MTTQVEDEIKSNSLLTCNNTGTVPADHHNHHHITVIGLGAMGGGIARTLLRSNIAKSVTGYDLNSDIVQQFYNDSISVGKVHPNMEDSTIDTVNTVIHSPLSPPPTLLKDAIFVDTSYVIIVLLNEKQCDEVCFGSTTENNTTTTTEGTTTKPSRDDHNLLSLIPNNCSVICCSTVSAAWAKYASTRFRNELNNPTNNRNIEFVDCPISGGPTRALRGTLTVMPSADNPNTLEHALPILTALAQSSTTTKEGGIYVIEGGAGMGSMVKMVHQLLAGVHICVCAEALALAAKAGLNVHQVYDIVNGAAGASWMFQDRGQRMIQYDECDVKSSLDIFVKDLDIVYNEARRLQSPIPLASAALQQFISGQSIGLGKKDDSQVVKVYEMITGTTVGANNKTTSRIDKESDGKSNTWIMEDGTIEDIVEVGSEPRHAVILRNDYVRVLRVSFPPNDTTLAHRHSEDSIYFFLVELDGNGNKLEVVNHVQGMSPCCDCMDFGEVRYGTHKTDKPLVHKITNKSNQEMLCIDAEILQRPPVTAAIPLLADFHKLIKTREKCRVYQLSLQPGETVTVTYAFFHLTVVMRPGTIEYETNNGIRWIENLKKSNVEWKSPIALVKMTNVGLLLFEQFIAEWI